MLVHFFFIEMKLKFRSQRQSLTQGNTDPDQELIWTQPHCELVDCHWAPAPLEHQHVSQNRNRKTSTIHQGPLIMPYIYPYISPCPEVVQLPFPSHFSRFRSVAHPSGLHQAAEWWLELCHGLHRGGGWLLSVQRHLHAKVARKIGEKWSFYSDQNCWKTSCSWFFQ